MNDKRVNLGQFIALFLMLLGLVSIVMDLSTFQVPILSYLVSIFLVTVFLAALNRKPVLVIGALSGVAILFVSTYHGTVYYESFGQGFALERFLYQTLHMHEVVDFFVWFVKYTFTPYVPIIEEYMAAGLGMYLLFAGAYLMLAMKSKWTRWMLFLPLIIFIVLYFFYYDLPWSVYNFYIAGLFIYYINVGFMKNKEKVESKRVAYRTSRLNMYGISLIVMLLVASNLVAALLPLESMNKWIDPMIPDIWQLRSEYERPTSKVFSFTSTSFQRFSDQLGGPIYEFDGLDIMRVRNYSHEKYLRGVVKNVYTGSRWSSEDRGYFEESFVTVDDPSNVKTMSIKYLNMATGTLFAPLGTVGFSVDEEQVIYTAEGEIFFRSEVFKPRPSIYRVSFTGIDTYYDQSVDYTTVPPIVENAVHVLTHSITNDAMSDEEKMNAIIQYLRGNYSYSLIPSSNGNNRDFVSQFILEGESGYCTYFASSLAIMGRIAGVPTRYVEGFIIPPVSDRDNYYYIKDEHAHTWVEAYIDGKGWVQFEATPIYSETDVPIDEVETIDLQEILEAEIEQAIAEGNDEKLAELEALKEADLENIRTASESVKEEKMDFGWLWYLLIFPVAILLLYLFGRIRVFIGDYRRQSLLRIYNIKDLCIEKNGVIGETLRRKIARVYPSLYNGSILALFEKILYGEYTPSRKEMKEINAYHRALKKAAMRRLGLVSYFFITYTPRRKKG